MVRVCPALPEEWSFLPSTHVRLFITTWNSIIRVSLSPSGPLGHLHTHGGTYMCIHSHTQSLKTHKFKGFLGRLTGFTVVNGLFAEPEDLSPVPGKHMLGG